MDTYAPGLNVYTGASENLGYRVVLLYYEFMNKHINNNNKT